VSNLILNPNIYLRDAKDDPLLQSMSADFRGNTEESWSRALSYLIRKKLLVEPDAKHWSAATGEALAAARVRGGNRALEGTFRSDRRGEIQKGRGRGGSVSVAGW
jgi:hypothetical protein